MSACVCLWVRMWLCFFVYTRVLYVGVRRKKKLWLLSCFVNVLFISFHKLHLEDFETILAPSSAAKTNQKTTFMFLFYSSWNLTHNRNISNCCFFFTAPTKLHFRSWLTWNLMLNLDFGSCYKNSKPSLCPVSLCRPRPTGSLCAELQTKVLQCYRENHQQTLLCSSLAKQYIACVQQAKVSWEFGILR